MEEVQVLSVDPTGDAAAEAAANQAALDRAAKGTSDPTALDNDPSASKGDAEGGDLILGKFKDHSELERAYSELQKKLGQPKDSPPSEEPTDSSDDAPKDTDAVPKDVDEEPKKPEDLTLDKVSQEAKETVEQAGLDFDALTQEFNDNGGLSEGTYESLEKAGIGRQVVDNYVAGQQAIQAFNTQQVLAEAGGYEEYLEMAQWASNAYTEAEQGAFDRALQSGDLEMAKLAVSALKARYVNENGTGSPRITVDGSTGSISSDAFQSKRQQVEAMRDPRYKKDPAYREEVLRKTLLAKEQGLW